MSAEIQFTLTDEDQAQELFAAFKNSGQVSKQARASSYLENGDTIIIGIDPETFAARLIPLKEYVEIE